MPRPDPWQPLGLCAAASCRTVPAVTARPHLFLHTRNSTNHRTANCAPSRTFGSTISCAMHNQPFEPARPEGHPKIAAAESHITIDACPLLRRAIVSGFIDDLVIVTSIFPVAIVRSRPCLSVSSRLNRFSGVPASYCGLEKITERLSE
jgi:hypothetical protein